MALFFYKEKNKDIRAAAYLRLSIEDGDKAESNSIGNQRELIRDFAAERPGLYLVEEYADDGYTGTNFERPGFKRMMEDIKSGKINCIIVKDLSRLGRNYIEMGKYLEQIFPIMGIRFIAINDNYDNANTESSDSDSIVVPFKNLLNDSYCRDISIKVRSQLDMKRRKGEFIGGYAIYGYCKDKRNKNRLVVDEYAADIVRSIYRRKLEGMSAQAIAEQLNSENVLAPSEYKRLCGLNYHSGFKAGTHAKWQAIQVLRILKNEVYTGTMVQGRRQKINYKIKKIRDVEESGWIRVPNMHEAIIPQKLFDTVQEVLKLDTCASKGQQTVNLFSGIVRCGGCGQNMVRRTVSKNGKKYIYLHCVTNHNGLGCSSHLISESKLAEVVLAALQGKVQQISGLEHRLDEINEIPKNERRLKSVEEHLKMLEQEEQKYQTLRRQLYEDMSSGIVSKEEYKEFSHSFNEKVETIRKAKAEMNRQRDCLNNLDVEHIEKYIHECYDGKGIKGSSPKTTFIAYGADLTLSKLADDDEKLVSWYKEKGLTKKGYYLVVGRFVPENSFEVMIREFMKSKSKKDFAIITNVNEKFLNELEEKLHFKSDKRIKFVGTVYDQELLKKIRENAYPSLLQL